ncbi:MAG: hypothetical protein AAFQ16_10665, partial [Pseudomonadota bacterium]
MDAKDMTEETKALVEAQLRRILASRQFRSAPRMEQFLTYLVTETIAGRSSKLKGYTIGVDVFQRDKGFDPQSDSIVRVEAARLRRMLHNYYLHSTDQDTIEIAIPKGTYIPAFGDIGDFYGLGTAEAERESSRQGFSEVQREVLEFPLGPSLVVLPFNNLSASSKHEIFARGLTEEITTRISQFSTLFVMSGHTAKTISSRPEPLHTVCRELGVHYALQGSVRIEGDLVRVSTQLADTTNGTNIWSQSFDKDLSVQGMIELQDDIGHSLTAAIADPHGVITRHDWLRIDRRERMDLQLYTLTLHWFEYVRHYSRVDRENLQSRAIELSDRHPNSS